MSKLRPINLQQPVKVEPPKQRRRREVEHVLHRCHRCHGTGQANCQICAGSGETLKGRDLWGKPLFTRCCGCFGTKTMRCSACGGVGWL